jgi:[protein-PII] uridylyltransferase
VWANGYGVQDSQDEGAVSGKTPTDSRSATADFLAQREALLRRPGPPGPGRRSALVALTDNWLSQLFSFSGMENSGSALVAVGGYGRGELAIGSDLDLLLLQRSQTDELADELWYPIWDSGLRLDHSVRTLPQARKLAGHDFKVMLGLLDARTVAGDDLLSANLLSSVRSDWRASASRRLEEIRSVVVERRERSGDLAHLLEPDLKESYGGLRDLVVLRSIAASWVTDRPHGELGQPKGFLLDVRDALHRVTGKRSDRLLMQEHEAVAETLGMGGADELMREVSSAGRDIAWASDTTWYRAIRAARPAPRRRLGRLNRRTDRRHLAKGVVEQQGDVVLAVGADPESDPGLILRAAAAAANAGLQLTPHTVERLADRSVALSAPWPREARESLVSLLGAGRALVPVWESLDRAGAIEHLIPLWGAVRNAPQHNPVHQFTVDRHLIETVVNASQFQREVARPDLLLVAALLHDIGKGRPGQDHTDLGVELVAQIAPELGFGESDTDMLVNLVRHHLLLPHVATRRDPDDPATLEAVMDAVGDLETLNLLYALTRADAVATGPAAWTDWRAALVADLVDRVRGAMAGVGAVPTPDLAEEYSHLIGAQQTEVVVSDAAPGDLTLVAVVSADHTGLLATIAGVLSVNRLDVRAARVASASGMGATQWWVTTPYDGVPSAVKLRESLNRALDGSLDVAGRVARREEAYAKVESPLGLEPRVDIVPDASQRATVVEVRTFDRPGGLFRLAGAIAECRANIVAARVDTLGSSVVDVFYLTDWQNQVLSDEQLGVVVERLSVVGAQ